MLAKLHYEADMSQVEIAKKMGVSAALVSRLLQKARALGIVRIEVMNLTSPEEVTLDLVDGLGLKRAAVIEAPSVGLLGALAPPLGALMKEEKFEAGSTIGVGWGRAVREVIAAGLPRFPGVRAVALNGGMQASATHFQINEFVRQAASNSADRPISFMLRTCRRSNSGSTFLKTPPHARRRGCGASLIARRRCRPAPFQQRNRGCSFPNEPAIGAAVGDVIRHYFDMNGTILPWEGEQRMLRFQPRNPAHEAVGRFGGFAGKGPRHHRRCPFGDDQCPGSRHGNGSGHFGHLASHAKLAASCVIRRRDH